MTRTFEFDARYQRFVTAQLALTLAAVGRDMRRRERGDPPTIPDSFVDQSQASKPRVIAAVGTRRELVGNAKTIKVPARRRNKIAREVQK